MSEQPAERVHLIADGEAVTSCCGRTPFELPRTERITVDPAWANCGQRDVIVKGALNLHMFRQRLTTLGVRFEVVPLSGDVPAENFTAYYRDRTVRITATAEQWAEIDQHLKVIREGL